MSVENDSTGNFDMIHIIILHPLVIHKIKQDNKIG